ncbi:hypothetical protein N2152v2_009601 [Parachlorella kessleri]
MGTTAGDPRDVEALAPLLEREESTRQEQSCRQGCSVSGGVANLTVTAVGAGMLALPKAFATVGMALGLSLVVFVTCLAYFSTGIIVKYAAQSKARSYGELIKAEFGPLGALILHLAITVHVGGVMVVYLIIIADVLVGGAPEFGGVLPTLLNRHDNPWFLCRPIVVAVLVLGVVVPMLIPRSLTSVARFSRTSIVMVLLLATTICSLAIRALTLGEVGPGVHVLPSFADIADGSIRGVATALLTVVSVSAMAFTCHFNLLPIQQSLKDPRGCTMLCVIRRTLLLCAAFYTTVAMSGYLLFGSKTYGDVLKNLNFSFVSGLVPRALAHALIDVVAFCYTFNLLVNFCLKVWAVRENVSEMALKAPALQLSRRTFYQLTLLLVMAAYALSIVVPSMWVLVSLVGSTACVTFSYVFPGLLVLRRDSRPLWRTAAGGMIVLAAVMAVLAIFNTLCGHGGL